MVTKLLRPGATDARAGLGNSRAKGRSGLARVAALLIDPTGRACNITHVIELPHDEIELTFARSSGPGGQHVNTSDTKVTLRWDVSSSPSLPEDVKERFIGLYGSRLTKEGVLVMSSEGSRSRQRNIDAVMKRLADMLESASQPPKPRTATRPSKASVERRLAEKARRAERKSERRPPATEE